MTKTLKKLQPALNPMALMCALAPILGKQKEKLGKINNLGETIFLKLILGLKLLCMLPRCFWGSLSWILELNEL